MPTPSRMQFSGSVLLVRTPRHHNACRPPSNRCSPCGADECDQFHFELELPMATCGTRIFVAHRPSVLLARARHL